MQDLWAKKGMPVFIILVPLRGLARFARFDRAKLGPSALVAPLEINHRRSISTVYCYSSVPAAYCFLTRIENKRGSSLEAASSEDVEENFAAYDFFHTITRAGVI